MGVLARLQKRVLEARKASEEHAAFLVMVLVEAHNPAKTENRAVTDADAGRAIATSIKQATTLLEGTPNMPAIPPDSPYGIKVASQRALLQTLVPTPPVGEDLAREIREAADGNDIPIEMKSMKAILAILNEKFDGQIDGKAVSAAIQAGV